MNISDKAMQAHYALTLTFWSAWVEHVHEFLAAVNNEDQNAATRKWHVVIDDALGYHKRNYRWSQSSGEKYEDLDGDICTLSNGEVYRYDMVPE